MNSHPGPAMGVPKTAGQLPHFTAFTSGAGERIRTADLPFTRSTARRTACASCTDSAGHCSADPCWAGITGDAVPRAVPRHECLEDHSAQDEQPLGWSHPPTGPSAWRAHAKDGRTTGHDRGQDHRRTRKPDHRRLERAWAAIQDQHPDVPDAVIITGPGPAREAHLRATGCAGTTGLVVRDR
jgi:hypothetical protein